MFERGRFKVLKNKELTKNATIVGVNVVLILLALNLLSINFAIVESSFMRIATVYLLIGVIIFNLSFKNLFNTLKRKKYEKISFNKAIAGILIMLFSFVLLIFTNNQMLWLASIPILLSGLNLTLKGVRIKRKELHLLSVASFVYAIFYILVGTIPIFWNTMQHFSLSFSSAVGALIGKTMLLGPSTSGLWILIIFFLLSCCIFFLTGLKKRLFALNIIGLVICWVIYLAIIGFVEFQENADVINLHYLLFSFCFVPTFLYLYKSKYKGEPSDVELISFKDLKAKKLVKNVAVWALVLLFISSIILTAFPGAGYTNDEDSNKNVLLYGQNMLGSWDVPEYGKYGKAASGMFGLLPYYLKDLGYNTQVVVNNRTHFLNISLPVPYENITRYVNITEYSDVIQSTTITSDLLADIDIFVVINLNTTFSPSEHEAIWNFVENGGSLLVLGDHTNIDGMTSPLNTLLEPVGISYRFDSGLPIDVHFRWEPCYHLMNHPMTYMIDEVDEIQISVGASLDISYGSFPIIQGKYGLSDIGDESNEERAFLGDYSYNPNEQIGDIILAAGAYYGSGKVVVFGDTSSFQNLAIPSSFPLVNSVFSWLSSGKTALLENTQIILSLIFLAIAFVLYLKFTKSKIRFVFFPLALCFALIITAFANPIMLGENEIKGNIIYIDTSHIERFNLKSYEDDSLSGLMVNLIRNDYLPLILKDFSTEKIENCKVLIFNAPTKTFSDGEVESIKQFMSNGGLAILSTGYDDKEASMPLLSEFGLDIDEIPLGPVPYVEQDPEVYQKDPRFASSWPILGDIISNYNVSDPEFQFEDGETYAIYSFSIADFGEYCLMTFTKHGSGGLLLISDSEYLLDQNIEALDDYWPGNIQFIYHIIDIMIDKGVIQ